MAERVFVALDLETTGLNADRDAITEVAAVRIQHGRITDQFSTLVNPKRKIPLYIQQLTGIRNEDVVDAPPIEAVLPELMAFVTADVDAIIAHNARFDIGFLAASGLNFHRPALDTFELASILLPRMTSYSLGGLCNELNIKLTDAHRALDDTVATASLFLRLAEHLNALPINTLEVIVAAAQGGEKESRWAPLLLFQDALHAKGGPIGPLPRTDLQQRINAIAGDSLTQDGLTQNLRDESDESDDEPSLVENGPPPATAVDLNLIQEIFAPDGRLAQLMGDAYEQRQGQTDMAHHVLDSLNQGDHLILEAGTGVGKSLGYLAPAAIWSRQNEQTVVIATNTIALQDQLVEKDIPQVQMLLPMLGIQPVRTALLKGRRNYLCTRRLHEWVGSRQLSPPELSVLARILVWLPETRTGDVGEIFLPSKADKAIWDRFCSDGITCSPARCLVHAGVRDFYFDARKRAEHAHLLVVNHALLIADLEAGRRVLPAYGQVIVDEAHRFEEATTEQLTYSVDWTTLQRSLARLSLEGDLVPQIMGLAMRSGVERVQSALGGISTRARQASTAVQRFADHLQHFAKSHKTARSDAGYAQRLQLDRRMRSQPEWSEIEIEWDGTAQLLAKLCQELHSLADLLELLHWNRSDPEARFLSETRGLTGELDSALAQLNAIILQGGILKKGSSAGQNIVAWIEYAENRRSNEPAEARLVSAPLYVGGMLQEQLIHQCRSTIFTGATLSSGANFGYIRERLGLWDAAAITVPSPFDYEQSTLLLMPRDLALPNESAYQQSVNQAIVDAAIIAGGRTMVLFTSYSQLRTTASAIREQLDQMDISLLQHGASSRRRLLREFRHSERAVLLGTRTFWEGIDLPGEQLSVLIIARLPFAVPSDPLVAARSQEFENPFHDYTVPDAILRFRQGFGRLIRRTSDRGVVILLDSRVWRKSYGHSFQEALPLCTVSHAPLSDLGAEVDLWLNR